MSDDDRKATDYVAECVSFDRAIRMPLLSKDPMKDLKSFLSRPLLVTLAICALPVVVLPALDYLVVAPGGSQSFLWLEIYIILPFMAALIALVISPFFLVFRRTRYFAFRALISGVRQRRILFPA